MQEIIIETLNALIPIIVATLAAMLTWVGNKIRTYYDEKTKNETVKTVVDSTVKYVEQVCKDLHGEEKLAKAKEVAMNWLNEKGIKMSDAELTILIESFVNGLK